MDFPQQLQACVEQANEALRRFIAPQPFQNTPRWWKRCIMAHS